MPASYALGSCFTSEVGKNWKKYSEMNKKSQQRLTRICIRLFDSEKAQIEKLSKKRKYNTISDYIRDRLFSSGDKFPSNDIALIFVQRQDEVLQELHRLINHFSDYCRTLRKAAKKQKANGDPVLSGEKFKDLVQTLSSTENDAVRLINDVKSAYEQARKDSSRNYENVTVQHILICGIMRELPVLQKDIHKKDRYRFVLTVNNMQFSVITYDASVADMDFCVGQTVLVTGELFVIIDKQGVTRLYVRCDFYKSIAGDAIPFTNVILQGICSDVSIQRESNNVRRANITIQAKRKDEMFGELYNVPYFLTTTDEHQISAVMKNELLNVTGELRMEPTINNGQHGVRPVVHIKALIK